VSALAAGSGRQSGARCCNPARHVSRTNLPNLLFEVIYDLIQQRFSIKELSNPKDHP